MQTKDHSSSESSEKEYYYILLFPDLQHNNESSQFILDWCTQEITAGRSFNKGPPIWVSTFLDFYAAQAKSALENKIWQKYYWKDVELNWH